MTTTTSESTGSTTPSPSATDRRFRVIAGIAIVLPAVAALAVLLWPSDPTRIGPIRGVLLGVGPAQARESLLTGGTPGRFRSSAMDEDFALDWAPTGSEAASELRSARLEFHLGQLVAMRLIVSSDADEAGGEALEVSAGSILVREPGAAENPGAVQITWLARTCPTHADEVASHLGER
ncbi:MAG: hypothetical protein AB8I08_21860 [Sandaracinaceae bacterium]